MTDLVPLDLLILSINMPLCYLFYGTESLDFPDMQKTKTPHLPDWRRHQIASHDVREAAASSVPLACYS